MKKIKKIWQKYKILIVLVLVLICCFIAICSVAFTYFFGGSDSVYGDRLDDQKKHPIKKEFSSELISKLEKDEQIEKVDFKVKGRVVYLTIDFVKDTALEEAETKATTAIQEFSEDLLNYYDIDVIIKCQSSENSDGYTIMGAKNVSSANLVWNNNNPRAESEEE